MSPTVVGSRSLSHDPRQSGNCLAPASSQLGTYAPSSVSGAYSALDLPCYRGPAAIYIQNGQFRRTAEPRTPFVGPVSYSLVDLNTLCTPRSVDPKRLP